MTLIKKRWVQYGTVLFSLILMAQMAFPAYAESSDSQTESANAIEDASQYDIVEETDSTAEEWDLSRPGTLTVNAGYVSTGTDRTPVEGIEFTVYQVATVTSDSGNVTYTAVEDLKDYEYQMNAGMTADSYSALADALAVLIAEDDSLAASLCIGSAISASDGNAVFEDIMPGMYLVVQTNTVSKYKAISPFFVAMPMVSEDGTGWDYNIQAMPKLSKTSSSGGSSSSGHSSRSSSGSSGPSDRTQTINTDSNKAEVIPIENRPVLIQGILAGDNSMMVPLAAAAVVAFILLIMLLVPKKRP